MKKKYIRPESRLYAINLAEKIASSGIDSSGDLVGGNSVIKFSHDVDNCRGYYTDDLSAPVTVTGTFYDYYNELDKIVTEKHNYFVYFNCLKAI